MWGHKKDFGVTAFECPHVSAGPRQNRAWKFFHWGVHACAGGLDILKIYF